ncbi:MAG: hypothetical protein U0Z75_08805 [Deinococcaceae bacterium]
MGELLHPDLQGKLLEEIIMHPTLWAKRIKDTFQEGFDALSDLQVQLSKIEGPVARARECQALILLDKPKEAAKVIEGETHNLCKAMHLAVTLHNGTTSDYLYIIQQPEILTRDRSDLGLESQMRWDFMRAQSYQQQKYPHEALHCHTLAHRIAGTLDVDSIVQVSGIQIQALSYLPLKHKIETLSIQFQEIQKNKDLRVNEYILENLCVLYFLDDDIESLRRYASELLPQTLLDHTILLTDFFLSLPPSAQIHTLDQINQNQPFCASGYLLSVARESKWNTYLLRNNQNIAAKLKPVLDTEVPDNLNVSILNLIMLSVKIMAHVSAEDFKKAENYWGQMQFISELSEVTNDLPFWAMYYMAFTEAFLAYSKGEKIDSKHRETIIEGLENMESFANFVVQLCPELVYILNRQEWDEVLENVLREVLVITKEGCFLGDLEVDGFPEHSALVEEIDRWYRGVAKRDPELMEGYAKRVSGIGCKGVVVAWKVEEKMRETK